MACSDDPVDSVAAILSTPPRINTRKEYVRVEPPSSHLRAERPALPEALRIAGEIAEAHEEAHSNRFVHRELKPGNIMVTAQNHVKVLDLGPTRRAVPSEIEPTLNAGSAQLTSFRVADRSEPDRVYTEGHASGG